ncbi:MAG: TolC family outer membrane protein [Hyphomicrobiaceae bacterium]|nr:TolC family outer membrane protein [Hyphomicrobiaceae bacterium]
MMTRRLRGAGSGRVAVSRTLLAVAMGALLVSASPLALVSAAHAESLNDALSSAYRYNPRIDAERARLRATDESVPRALSGYRPRINATGDVTIQDNRTRFRDEDVINRNTQSGSSGRTGDTIHPRGYGFSVQQNLFDGFQTPNAVGEAESNVRAGRESLRDVERQVLLDAATAYMDVVRDQAVVRLQDNNVNVLTRELTATQDRFNVGEVTKTDVAQARARRAGAVSSLDLARANLKSSRARYERVVGNAPSNLVDPPVPTRALPSSLDAALNTALNESPVVLASLYLEQASRYAVDVVRAELLPVLNLEGTYSNRFSTSSTVAENETTTLAGRLSVPIYEGGEVSARVRAAKHTHVSRLQEVEDARQQVREQTISAWSQFQAAQAQLISDRTQVEANQTALTGVREEERVGQRTLLDVLNAEQELLNAQVQFETTRRNVIVAAYNLLAAIGRLDAANIGVAAEVYDPDVHYHEVRRQWWGISITDRDGRRETLDLWESHGKRHEPAK